MGWVQLSMAIVVVLNPWFKIVLIKFCFSQIYQEPEASKNVEDVSQRSYGLYDEYVKEYNFIDVAQRE